MTRRPYVQYLDAETPPLDQLIRWASHLVARHQYRLGTTLFRDMTRDVTKAAILCEVATIVSDPQEHAWMIGEARDLAERVVRTLTPINPLALV